MEDGRAAGRRAPRYKGEDTSQTTEREIRGWYLYGVAAEVFAVCGVGSFLPVTLEQLAKENAVLWSDRTTSCMSKAAAGVGDAVNTTAPALLARASAPENTQCIIRLFGSEITTSSFAMYTFSAAVFIQALALVSFSSVADHGDYRKRLLVAFGFTGAISSMLFILVVPKIYLLGAILVVVGVTCLGSSFVLLNAFLPLLVANHPLVVTGGRSNQDSSSIPLESLSPDRDSVDDEERDDRRAFPSVSKSTTTELQLSSKISSKGVGIGYIAAVFVQILSILVLFLMSKKKNVSSTLPLRLVLLMVGIWWFAFTIPSSMWLRDRPGPPLETASSHRNKWRAFVAYFSFAWISLWKTIKVAIKLRQMIIFLIAWFLLSDAIATVSGTAILFARTELKMGTVAIALLSITSISSGIAGAFFWPIISRRYGLQTNRTIVACVAFMEIIPLYGLLGYLPFVQAWGVGGLQKAWEIYPLGIIHGFVMGGLSSYCRSFFGLLIPPGSEAAFYALYAITDKGSSAFGPAVVGLIVDATGHIRPAFIFLAVLILLPAPLVWMVDVKKGQEDAVRMAGLLKKIHASEIDPSDDGMDVVGAEERFHESRGLMRDHD